MLEGWDGATGITWEGIWGGCPSLWGHVLEQGDDWAQGLPTTPDEEHLARPGGAESCPLK